LLKSAFTEYWIVRLRGRWQQGPKPGDDGFCSWPNLL